MEPEIYIEFNLVFDNDCDVEEITKVIEVIPYECRNRMRNRINPLTDQPLESFWTLRSPVYREYNAEKALNSIVDEIKPLIPQILDIIQKYNGEAIFCIVASFEPDKKPAIYFERNFLEMVEMLQATVQLDFYIE